MNEPIGLVGFWKAGSFRSTSVWVTTVDACLFDAALQELVVQRLLEHVADGALACRRRSSPAAPRAVRGATARAAQDEADLRAVAVRHHHVPARLDHVGDVVASISTAAAYWSGTVLCCSSLISELPPTATTATFSLASYSSGSLSSPSRERSVRTA